MEKNRVKQCPVGHALEPSLPSLGTPHTIGRLGKKSRRNKLKCTLLA